MLVMSYTENHTKFFKERGTLNFALMWTLEFNNTCMVVCHEFKSIFMGNSLGGVRCYQWPFQDMSVFSKNFSETSLHCTAVTQMKISSDLAFLITGS